MKAKGCPILKVAGVSCDNAGYNKWTNAKEAKRIADICTNCPYDHCVFDEDNKKQIKLENTLLDLTGRAYLTSRQVKRLKEVQCELEEMNGEEHYEHQAKPCG